MDRMLGRSLNPLTMMWEHDDRSGASLSYERMNMVIDAIDSNSRIVLGGKEYTGCNAMAVLDSIPSKDKKGY